ncbi:MAG: 2-phospho-L-lactate transferase [Chromatiales bacterium]|nr:2-phospho-L-lactate transferase [Chromatiales bacterium]
MSHDEHWLLLCGGVGGAKLALGLAHELPPGSLTVLVNTGDDFRHLGLWISPDLDTVTYTLAGLVNPATGWGLAGDTFHCLEGLSRLSGPDWFRLGDRDLATHLERTRRLAAGERLGSITSDLASRLGVSARIWPMSDDPVATLLHTDSGLLEFQDYFVRRQAAPVVRAIEYHGASEAGPAPGLANLLKDPGLAGIIIAPSNPWLSIDPILALPGLRQSLADARAPVVAVSPLIAGQAVKGPSAKIMRELGLPPDAQGIARHYLCLLDGFILDDRDEAEAAGIGLLGLETVAAPTLMRSLDDRRSLARVALGLARRLGNSIGRPHRQTG